MSVIESAVTLPSTPERITIVLKAQEGSTLEHICQFVSLGMPVAIGRGMAVIAGASDEDLQAVLGQERDDRTVQSNLHQDAMGAPAHLAAHAKEMFDLLHRINVKVGGLNAVLGHGGEPSEQMWDELDEAMDAIWDLLDKVKAAEAFGVATSMHIDDRVKMAANAKRYEWLRNVAATTGSGHTPMVKVAGGPGRWRTGEDLDQSIDQAMRAWPGQQDEEQQPCVD